MKRSRNKQEVASALALKGPHRAAATSARYLGDVTKQAACSLTTRLKRLEAGQPDAGDWWFWGSLIDERGITVDRPRGQAHPRYPDMIYPCDYGHIPGTVAADGHEIDAFTGTEQAGLVGLIALTHQPSRVADPKLLVNLTREDAAAIVALLVPPRVSRCE